MTSTLIPLLRKELAAAEEPDDNLRDLTVARLRREAARYRRIIESTRADLLEGISNLSVDHLERLVVDDGLLRKISTMLRHQHKPGEPPGPQ